MTFLLIVIIIIICWPWISKWIKTFMSHRAEDAIRRMMGMPSRKEEQRRKQQTQGQNGKSSRRNKNASASTPEQEREADRQQALKSMKDNAVDVEYTEYKEFSQTEIAVEDERGNTTIYTENQVTDVEYIEIKESDNNKK